MSNPKKTRKEIREVIEKRKAKPILHPDEKAIADVDEAIDEIMNSECCGAKFIDDSDLCPKCLEHTGRE